ncbi:glycosyltransferase family 39 protein [Pelolinea submarina]|uniref:Dolichyl-phosphate-mannose-protein mannosyltransferase n=1 Tax=Pelolinea submarina TaxID=913107 RepID=A0A347ZU47_9CHLR|nr:glycosyltransferase family 39 protein [Pelolinea submarina]REG10588.1 dolichyl-phosphate-mannose-protein mannosyltransferase [Pelolinea submarina]BBB48828.1 hypothetical protein Pelsub_P2059 [Pelolinea submarina]
MGNRTVNTNFAISTKAETSNWLWWLILCFDFLVGGGLAGVFSLPYGQAHAVMRWLSPKHRMASLTETAFHNLQPWAWAMGGVLLALGLYQLVRSRQTKQWAASFSAWVKKHFRQLPGEFAQLWDDARPKREYWPYTAAVLVLMGAAVLVRWLFLSYPMRYDEAYTVTTFASRPWRNLISDYSLPNNHIFHTVLVKLSMDLFGSAPWAVRLPAFISGILCVPAGYMLARQLYGRQPAVLSAGLIAMLPMLIETSTNARGYSQYTFLSLLLFSLAVYLVKHANLAGWLLFTLIGILGFYTAPFMLYPFGAACFWILVSGWLARKDTVYGSFGRLLKYLIASGVLVIIGTLILYSPVILIGTGLQSLIGNPFVGKMSWTDFWPILIDEMESTWMKWHFDLPLVVRLVLAGGFVLSLVFHKVISKVKVPLQVTSAIWLAAVVIPMRRNPYDRLWVFMLPLWLIWASAGLLALLNGLKEKPRFLWQNAATIGILVIGAVWSYQRVHVYFPGWQADPGKIEQAAEFLSQNLEPGDAVAVVFPSDAQYWYYLERMGVGDEYMHRIEQESHPRVFAVVSNDGAATATEALLAHQLSPEEYQVDQAELVYRVNDQLIFLCIHR